MSGGDADAKRSPPTEDGLRSLIAPLALEATERGYCEVHLSRYVRALELMEDCLLRCPTEEGGKAQVLDVAPHLLSFLFAKAFPVIVNTVGLPYHVGQARTDGGEHLQIDLNDLHDRAGWRGFVRHDVVFMGEILEHLHAAPSMVLGCVSRWVKPGGFLVLQTPNAVSLSRRMVLLAGRNPYEMLKEGINAGHIREYTAEELIGLARPWGLDCERVHYENYFRLPHRGPVARILYDAFTRFPRTFRDGMSLVFRKRPDFQDPEIPSRLLTGALEHAAAGSQGLDIVGWLADLDRRRPVASFEIWRGDDLITTVSPDMDRPDVAEALGDAAYLPCGFHVTLPAPGLSAANVMVCARDRFGDPLRLRLASTARLNG